MKDCSTLSKPCLLSLFILLVGYGNTLAAKVEIPVWATSDSVKIFKDSPNEEKNIVWAAKDDLVSIKGARNETVAFQLVINGQDNGLSEVTVIPSALRHSDGINAIPIESYDLFLEWYTLSKIKKGSDETKYYPDALIPFYNPYGSNKYAVAAFFDIKPNENQPVWVDLNIPKNVAAGEYKGTMEVVSGGKTLKSINLNLTVLPFTIPDERHVTAYSEMYGIDKKEGLKDLSKNDVWEIKKEYWIMARKHRFDFGTTGYELDPSASSNWDENGIYRENSNVWAQYDEQLGQVISGEIFPDKLPPNVWRLPFPEAKTANLYGINCKYSGKDTWDKSDGCYKKDYAYQENKITSLAKTIEEHFLEKEIRGEWPKGTLAKSFVYIIDEPKQYEHYPYIKDYSRLIHRAAPNIKFMLTEQPEEPIFGDVDIWAVAPSALAPERMRDRQKNGEKVWFYQGAEPYSGSVKLTDDAIALRMWAWIAWKYGVDGVFLWAIDYWSSDNPYTDPQVYESGKPTNNWGDGYLFYPGAMLSTIGFPAIDGPVSSIRMKMWRRGFLDYEYMWLAKESGKEKEAGLIVNSIVKSALAENYKEITNPIECAKKKFDGQKTKFVDGKCVGACSDFTNKSCWYNDGILIGPWDCDDGPDESGKYPQWWQDPRVKKFNGWSKNPEDWVSARYQLAQLIKEEVIDPLKGKPGLISAQNPNAKLVYQRKREAPVVNVKEKADYLRPGILQEGYAQITEDFSAPLLAESAKAFGQDGQLTFELYRGGTFAIDGISGYAWQKSDSYRDSAFIRSSEPLPKTYKITVIIGDIDYDLGKIDGLKNDPEYKEGPLNENGAYLLAITDEKPSGHHTNDWWHQHRKVVMDVDNNTWGSGMPNPIFMVYFDKENKLVSFNTKEDQWKYAWEKAATYENGKWYRIELEKNNFSYVMTIYDADGKLLSGGIVPLKRVWHTEEIYPEYLVVGDPHENYYQGSMKIKSISIPVKIK